VMRTDTVIEEVIDCLEEVDQDDEVEERVEV
jgi:hypothetical protein